jgi:hypothetical protein
VRLRITLGCVIATILGVISFTSISQAQPTRVQSAKGSSCARPLRARYATYVPGDRQGDLRYLGATLRVPQGPVNTDVYKSKASWWTKTKRVVICKVKYGFIRYPKDRAAYIEWHIVHKHGMHKGSKVIPLDLRNGTGYELIVYGRFLY